MPDLGPAAARFAAGTLLLSALLIALHTDVSDPTAGAVLGIAAQTMAGTVQECRTLSAEELTALPRHMRQPQECISRAVRYRLEVEVDGTSLLDRVYAPAGIHGDRPISIAERVGVTPGSHAVMIRLAPLRETAGQNPPTFAFAQVVSFEDGRVRVATLGGDGFEFR